MAQLGTPKNPQKTKSNSSFLSKGGPKQAGSFPKDPRCKK